MPLFSAIDLSQVVLASELKKNDMGGLFANLTVNGAPLIVQTPELFATTGIKIWTKKESDKKDYSLLLSLNQIKDATKTGKMQLDFSHFLTQLDDSICNQVYQYYVNGEKSYVNALQRSKITSVDSVVNNYTGYLKPPVRKDDKEYPPSISPKLHVSVDKKTGQESFKTSFWSHLAKPWVPHGPNSPIDLTPANAEEIIPRHSTVKCLLHIKGIWIIDRRFMLAVDLTQVKISPPQQESGYAFEDDEEEKKMISQAKEEQTKAKEVQEVQEVQETKDDVEQLSPYSAAHEDDDLSEPSLKRYKSGNVSSTC
jgi:hypothetical protein